MDLYLPGKQLRVLLATIIALNVLLLTGTGAYFYLQGSPHNALLDFILVQSNLAWENNGAAWYSSMLLLLVATMSFVCFIKEKHAPLPNKKNSLLVYGWLVFGAVFTILSLDETGSLHENINHFFLLNRLGLGGGLQSNSLYAIIIAVGFFMVLFFWLKFKRNKIALVFIITGTLFYISNPIQERIEVAEMMAAPDYNTWHRPIYYFILEEGSEIFGTLFFLIAVSLYAIDISEKNSSEKKRLYIYIKSLLNRKVLSIYMILIFASLSILFFLTKIDANTQEERGDNGIPQNWFPSALAFLAALISIYKYTNSKIEGQKRQLAFLLLGIASLFSSFYFGSDVYERVLEKSLKIKLIPTMTFSVFVLITGVSLLMVKEMRHLSAFILAWIALLIASINVPAYSSQLSFAAFGLLFASLCLFSNIITRPRNRK